MINDNQPNLIHATKLLSSERLAALEKDLNIVIDSYIKHLPLTSLAYYIQARGWEFCRAIYDPWEDRYLLIRKEQNGISVIVDLASAFTQTDNIKKLDEAMDTGESLLKSLYDHYKAS
jgi:hypothetical protein